VVEFDPDRTRFVGRRPLVEVGDHEQASSADRLRSETTRRSQPPTRSVTKAPCL
jgi:hypothetical protein